MNQLTSVKTRDTSPRCTVRGRVVVVAASVLGRRWPSLTLPFALQWLANPSNDMYADTVTTVILEVQSNPKIRKGTQWFRFSFIIHAFHFIIEFFHFSHGSVNEKAESRILRNLKSPDFFSFLWPLRCNICITMHITNISLFILGLCAIKIWSQLTPR